MFLYSYALTFTEAPAAPATRHAVTNTLLFSAFALHHSLFARLGIRRLVARMVPPGAERSVYVTAASLLFILLCLGWRLLPGTVWHLEGAATIPVHAVQMAGLVVLVRSLRVLDARQLAGLTTTSITPGRSDGMTFSLAGPYGRVRHPIYSAWLLLTFAIPHMTVTRLQFALLAALYIVIAIPLEERTLRRSAPDAYRAYQQRVRWKLVPGVY